MRSKGAIAWCVVLVILVAACGGPAPSPSTTAAPSASASLTPSTAGPSPSVAAGASVSIDHPIASSGSIALLAADSSLSIVETDGSSRPLADSAGGAFGFPSWSPDGSRIAVIRSAGDDTSLVVLDPAAAPGTTDPTVIFRKPGASPFYVYWAPDGRSVSFLVNDTDGLALRIAPADGRAPVDGSGKGSLVRSGDPFYFDWLAKDRLLAHIGTGSEAFLGEIDLDGTPKGHPFKASGDFRSAIASPDHESIAFVRGNVGGPGEVVVSDRGGSHEHTMPVFGQTALLFDPTGRSVASIASSTADGVAGFPLGPLKLIDTASGDVRTLLDGLVVSFWWSPDGKTIAALRVQPSVPPGGASASPSGEPDTDVRLIFVDVASGKTLSEPVVRPTGRFVGSLLAYFDQYALSHRLWAPDSASILLPELDATGATHVVIRYVDGSEPIVLDGEIAFWSP
jgi:TolB protein